LSAKEDLSFSSLFALLEGDPPPTSAERYEYESDSDLEDEEGNDLDVVQLAEELVTGGEVSASQFHISTHDAQPHVPAGDEALPCHDQLHISAPGAQSHRGLSVCMHFQ